MKGYVYHIEDPSQPGSLEHGYVGVVVEHRGIYVRFLEHATHQKYMRALIRNSGVKFEDHVRELFHGDLTECYDMEATLRPVQFMGWNLAPGGGGPRYRSNIQDLSKFRSEAQAERMRDPDLKKRQSESFKRNYYSDGDAQELRSLRAREHMADPQKKQKCIGSMHKQIKCPMCDFRSNKGNVAQHMKRMHS